MCGIVGSVGFKDSGLVDRMNARMTHRGPDDHGTYWNPETSVGLGMQRLSILDLAGGHQPMSHANGRFWIVFNGEIFNAPDLRLKLEAKGHQFRTRNSDTEVLLHLYEAKGPKMLEELIGMFAFVIYDLEKRLLFGARDHLGIKPLYLLNRDGRLAFASELKCLLALPDFRREVNPQSLSHYLTLLYVPDEASIFRGVNRLPPAHSFHFNLATGQLTKQRYWTPRFCRGSAKSVKEWVDLIRFELREAVRRWTLSDVPIACSLSGGIDSSAIVGLLAESGSARIKTYSLGFSGAKEQELNETALARQVAEKWGTEHHEFFLEPDALLDDLVQMVWHLDEPYAGGLPSWYVFREMARDVKVGLTGTGGDELFGNYGKALRYERQQAITTSLRLRAASPQIASGCAGVLRPFAKLANSLPASWRWVGKGRMLSQIPDLLQQPFGRHYYALQDYFSDEQKRSLVLNLEHAKLESTGAYLQGLFDAADTSDLRDGLAVVDLRTQLAEEFLSMTDRFSMAHSLEARVPFLDQQLVGKVFGIPSSVRADPLEPKHLLKQAVADLLPPDLLAAPKRGFVIPIEFWLRKQLRPLVENLLGPARLRKQGVFQPEVYERFVRPHLEAKACYTWQVWALLMFQLWHVVFIESKSVEKPVWGWRELM